MKKLQDPGLSAPVRNLGDQGRNRTFTSALQKTPSFVEGYLLCSHASAHVPLRTCRILRPFFRLVIICNHPLSPSCVFARCDGLQLFGLINPSTVSVAVQPMTTITLSAVYRLGLLRLCTYLIALITMPVTLTSGGLTGKDCPWWIATQDLASVIIKVRSLVFDVTI